MVIRTPARAPSFSKAYASKRGRAWRNMMVAAINAGLEQGVFALVRGGEKFATGRDASDQGVMYSFNFPGGVPALAHVRDGGWDEVRIHVVLWPSADFGQWVGVGNAGFRAGDAIASGWLERERERGAWIQVGSEITSRAARIETIEPNGYLDRGMFMM